MIELALRSAIIFGLAPGTNGLLRRTSAAQRQAIWMAAFASVPLLSPQILTAMPSPTSQDSTMDRARPRAPRATDEATGRTLNMGIRSFFAIGQFDDNRGADILTWSNNFWQALSSGSGSPKRQSRQDMR